MSSGPRRLQRRASAWRPAISRTTCGPGASSRPATTASYLQTVRVLGVKTTSPFDRHRDGRRRDAARSPTATAITFPKNMGGKRRFTVDRVEFAGYGLDAPGAGPHGLSRQGREGRRGRLARRRTARRTSTRRSYRRAATAAAGTRPSSCGAAASIGPAPAGGGRARTGRRGGQAAGRGGRRGGGPRRAAAGAPTSRPSQRLDAPVPPNVTRHRRVLRVPLQPARRRRTTS